MSEPSGSFLVFECRDVLAELSNYVDDDVAPEARREIERHLEHCRTCRVLIDSTRRTMRIVADDNIVEIPQPLARSIMDRIKQRNG
jgi:anti-sigma factor RsiW